MKTLTIYQRTVTHRTEYRQWRYKMVDQVSIIYNGREYSNHSERLDNQRLRIPFDKILETRNKKAVTDYIAKLGRTDSDKFQKETLKEILKTL